jgi:hypothetical protein
LQALLLEPSLRIAEEPFHAKYHEWNPDEPNYVDLITDIPSLERHVGALFVRYDGIKVLDYQLPEALYTHLLLTPELNVIFLRRRNLVRSVLSVFIAKQTGVWKTWDANGDLRSRYADLQPIPLDEFAENLEYSRELRATYGAVIARKPASERLVLEYEDFYAGDLERIRGSMRGVFAFLGLAMPDSARLDYYLDASTGKVNSEALYRLVPNVEDIEARFGSDENGWLFDRHRA